MPKLSPEIKTERRHELVDAAWRCAAVRGFRDTAVDDVCTEAGVSKGAFYGYFAQKQDLLLALLESDAESLDSELKRIASEVPPGVERLRRFAHTMLIRGEDTARMQLLGDVWAELQTVEAVRHELALATRRRREIVRGWIEDGIDTGELIEIPANALASLLLALADGLMLHRSLEPTGFRWENIQRAIDVLLTGIAVPA